MSFTLCAASNASLDHEGNGKKVGIAASRRELFGLISGTTKVALMIGGALRFADHVGNATRSSPS